MNEFDSLLEELAMRPPTREEALFLLQATEGDARASEKLYATARGVRRALTGDVFRFTGGIASVLRCTLKPLCSYCPYWRDRGGEPLSRDAIAAAAVRMQEEGLKSFHLSGGTTLGSDGEEMLEIVQAIHDAGVVGMGINVNCGAALSVGTMRRMRELGVTSVGAVFEITNPEVFARVKPGDDLERKMEFARDIGRAGLALSSGMMAGLGPAETRLEDYVGTLFDIARFPHLKSLYVSKFRPDPSIPMKDWPRCSVEEGMRVVAVARLVLRERDVTTAAGWDEEERAQGIRAGAGNGLFAFSANRKVGYWKDSFGPCEKADGEVEYRDTRAEKRRFAERCGVAVDEEA